MIFPSMIRCAEVSYKEIKITNLRTNQWFMLYSDLDEVNSSFEFNKAYEYGSVPVRDGMLGSFDKTFSPIQFELSGTEINSNMTYHDAKKVLRDKNTLYKLEVEDFYVIFRITGDVNTYSTITGYEGLSFKCETVSNFTREIEYEYTIDNDGGEDSLGFPYEFPRPLSGKIGNRYVEGTLKIEKMEGDTDAYLYVEILDGCVNPGFGLNANSSNTIESYQSKNTTLDDGDMLIVDSHPLRTRISKNGVNWEQSREFKGHYTYLKLNVDRTNTLFFTNVKAARVVVYEQYYNIPW